MTNFRLFQIGKLEDFADDNFKFDENGRKLSKLVENTVGKGEIARYEQFLLFPQCFQKACFPGASKGVIVWEWVNSVQKIVVTSIFSSSKNILNSLLFQNYQNRRLCGKMLKSNKYTPFSLPGNHSSTHIDMHQSLTVNSSVYCQNLTVV